MTEEYVKVYGEKYRSLIEDSLKWIDEQEKKWDVSINRDDFIRDLISNVSVL